MEALDESVELRKVVTDRKVHEVVGVRFEVVLPKDDDVQVLPRVYAHDTVALAGLSHGLIRAELQTVQGFG